MPYQFDFKLKNRSGDIYYKSAMALSPRSGIPHVLYAAQLADEGKTAEALNYGDKGYAMLSPAYKKIFANTYAMVLHGAERKEDAYKLLEKEIRSGNDSEDNLRTYFRFYSKDKRYQEGIDKATEMIPMDSTDFVLSRRAILYNEMGNNEKACEDAMLLRERFNSFSYLLKQFSCPQVMADVTPTQSRTYIYEVVFQGQTYDFRVSNPIVDMNNGISFKFKMTGDVGIGGLVNISKDAINVAHKQNNRFSNGDVELTDETTVWISNEVYNDIKTKGETVITADMMGEKQYEVISDDYNDDDEFYPVTVDDQEKYIKCIKIGSKDGDEEIWINDDPKNPLILKMKLSFSIELKQIL
jgi:tetratricopeptide (TPR) repeat protein